MTVSAKEAFSILDMLMVAVVMETGKENTQNLLEKLATAFSESALANIDLEQSDVQGSQRS